MKNSTSKAILAGALVLASATAWAQYAWIDEKGVRQYSDQPPPTTTPAAKILKLPRGMQAPTDDVPAAAPAAGAKAAPTLADREADYRKRHAEADKNEANAAGLKAAADSKRVQCDIAARNKAQLDTGRRTRGPDNTIVTEEDKAKELARVDKVLKDCK